MLDFATDLGRRAGVLLRDGLDRRRTIELKGAFDLVTDMDRASEDLIVSAIAAEFPDHAILAEESGAIGAAEYTWLIDPLDGTNNYAHGYPYFCVSLGLWRGPTPLLGVIYNPLLDELFSAEAGGGAHRNGQPIHVSDTAALGAALISTGFPYDYAGTPENNLREFDRIQGRCQGVRRGGAAALDLAYVAMGRLDAHWELRLKPWDTGAATLLVLEAGGRLSDRRGQPWHPWADRLVASNGRIHDELIEGLSAEG
ncbi:MAG TPA: inositol monophosphatase family protein [Roseiflexaceae bacterium]|nr:inositol monophosphatase family protein [Roseiflexaceae bacterium]